LTNTFHCSTNYTRFSTETLRKISYSCMNNVKSIITKHNAHILGTANHRIRKLTTVTATTKTLAHYRNNVWPTTLFTKPQSQRTTRTTLNTTLVWQRLHLRNVTLTTLHLFVIKKTRTKRNFRNIFGNFKTRYFVHMQVVRTLQFMFGRKILHFDRHKQR
jgi:hypothetical protein